MTPAAQRGNVVSKGTRVIAAPTFFFGVRLPDCCAVSQCRCGRLVKCGQAVKGTDEQGGREQTNKGGVSTTAVAMASEGLPFPFRPQTSPPLSGQRTPIELAAGRTHKALF